MASLPPASSIKPTTTPAAVAAAATSTKSTTATLSKRGAYKVDLQYYDETLVSAHFYVTLHANAERLRLLDTALQQQQHDVNAAKFDYVRDASLLKVGDFAEALYALDLKWYRVCVRSVDAARHQLAVFFVDYGNTELLATDADEFRAGRLVRTRLRHDSAGEEVVFALPCQAIKCCYVRTAEGGESGPAESVPERLSLREFIDAALLLDNVADGIWVKCNTVHSDDYDDDRFELNRVSYGVDLIASEADAVHLQQQQQHQQPKQQQQQQASSAKSTVSTHNDSLEVAQIMDEPRREAAAGVVHQQEQQAST